MLRLIRITSEFILISALFVNCSKINQNFNIYGEWAGSYNEQRITIVFKTDNSCELNYFDNTDNSIKIITGEFRMDFTKRPIPLTIAKIPQLTYTLNSIVEFSNDNTIKIAEFSPKWRLRPVTFTKVNTVVLKRSDSKFNTKNEGE